MQKVYLIVGVPGVGKSWVCNQLTNFEYIPHDSFMKGGYLEAIEKACNSATKLVLAETPFSISKINDPLVKKGIEVIPVFIIEDDKVLTERYFNREHKIIPEGHLTRQKTYAGRAKESKAFSGTSSEVLEHLKGIK